MISRWSPASGVAVEIDNNCFKRASPLIGTRLNCISPCQAQWCFKRGSGRVGMLVSIILILARCVVATIIITIVMGRRWMSFAAMSTLLSLICELMRRVRRAKFHFLAGSCRRVVVVDGKWWCCGWMESLFNNSSSAATMQVSVRSWCGWGRVDN